jgi:hypothetical protein
MASKTSCPSETLAGVYCYNYYHYEKNMVGQISQWRCDLQPSTLDLAQDPNQVSGNSSEGFNIWYRQAAARTAAMVYIDAE